MLHSPRSSPPAGGDHNKGPSIEIIIWVFTSIAIVTFISRVYGRIALTKNPGWDDFWMVIAMLCNLLYACSIEVTVKLGTGRHSYYLEPQQTSKTIKWLTIAFIPGVLAFAVPKLSVAVLLTRLLNPRKAHAYFMYFLCSTVIIGSIIVAIFLWQQCKPSSGLWDPSIKATCWSPSVVNDYTIVHGCRYSCLMISTLADRAQHFLLSQIYISHFIRLLLYTSSRSAPRRKLALR